MVFKWFKRKKAMREYKQCGLHGFHEQHYWSTRKARYICSGLGKVGF